MITAWLSLVISSITAACSSSQSVVFHSPLQSCLYSSTVCRNHVSCMRVCLQVLLWCVSLPKATNVAAAALAAVTACAAAAALQAQLVEMGVLANVFTRMLQCAPSPAACVSALFLNSLFTNHNNMRSNVSASQAVDSRRRARRKLCSGKLLRVSCAAMHSRHACACNIVNGPKRCQLLQACPACEAWIFHGHASRRYTTCSVSYPGPGNAPTVQLSNCWCPVSMHHSHHMIFRTLKPQNRAQARERKRNRHTTSTIFRMDT